MENFKRGNEHKPIPFVVQGKRDYNRLMGLPPIWEGISVPVNYERARRIGDVYANLPTCDNVNEVVQSYQRAAVEIHAQYLYARDIMFMHFEPWTSREREQPYVSSHDMFVDVADNRHLYFFTGGEQHPVFGKTLPGTGLTVDWEFRSIHDLFGHSAERNQFGPKGEENAWLSHSQMFTPRAQRAISAELRGQNSWLNFGPHMWNEDGSWRGSQIPIYERAFAEQKLALLPREFSDWEKVIAENISLHSSISDIQSLRRAYRLDL